MYLLLEFFVLIFSIRVGTALEVIPERSITMDVNPKYLKYMNTKISKTTRHSPYALSLELESLYGFGNNLSLDIVLLENLSGRFQPTMLRVTRKLCDYLQNEPYLGRMFAKQLGNYTCPFSKGEYHFKNMVININNFNFTIPFTWASVVVKTRTDTTGYIKVDSGHEKVFLWQLYATIIQKPKKEQ